MKAYNSSDFGSSRKKMRTAQHTDVEEALFQWFKNVRDQNIPISGPTLAAKADDLVIRLGHTYFTANHNWVERFKQRRGIVSRSINGESAAKLSTRLRLKRCVQHGRNWSILQITTQPYPAV